jgi:hypothetical protein
MAAGAWQVYETARERLMDGSYDLDNDTFICLLLSNSHTPNLDTHVNLADISGDEITDTDYSRVTLTSVTWDETNGTVTFDADDIDFGTSVDITARYAAIFDDTHGSDGLLCYSDLNDGGSTAVSSTQGTFLITLNASGIFTLTQA